MVTVVAATQLKVFAQLDGLRRAPGAQGELRSKLVNDGAFKVYLSEDGTNWSTFPRSEFSLCLRPFPPTPLPLFLRGRNLFVRFSSERDEYIFLYVFFFPLFFLHNLLVTDSLYS